jgi:hypothetical protein
LEYGDSLYCVSLVANVGWVGHAAIRGAMRNYYNSLVRQYEQKRQLGKARESCNADRKVNHMEIVGV